MGGVCAQRRDKWLVDFDVDKCLNLLEQNCINLSERYSADRTNLSPGKELVQNGLNEVKNCEYKIVLGHHPLGYFDEDVNPISALFGKNNVIYLHGHLHKTNACEQYGAGLQFLTIQTGAGFQAREDEKWINRLLWCELNLDERLLMVKPMQWSIQNQEWSIDGGAIPEIYRENGTDFWVLPLAQKKKSLKTPHKIKTNTEFKNFNIPNGWILIDKQFLSDRTLDLDNETVIKYFDGRLPIWRESLSPKIPRRSIVCKTVKDINEAKEMHVNLITGAGGEGKTTVLLQTICDLVQKSEDIKVLWINEINRKIAWPMRFLKQLQKGKGKWLIACDDSDLIAKKIFETLQAYNREERNDIQFLLCCRDTDWIASQANEWTWNSYCIFNEIRLRGISHEDCLTIVEAWSNLGEKGLGKLKGINIKEAAERLFIASKNAENEYSDEGAFLGAMLRVRMGDDLANHLKEIFSRIKTRTAIQGTLLDSYAYIAAMHAEGLSILTKDILAELFHCKTGEIKRQIIGPLGDEAAATTGGDFIYTRHRAIAEESIKILSDIYHIDFDDIFIELAESALYAYSKGVYIPSLGKWRFLSSYFFEKGNRTLAIKLNKALLKIDSTDSYLMTNLSKLLRKAEEPILAVQIFREQSALIEERSYFFEWGTAEGHCGNHCLSIYLAGFSLSDQAEKKFPTIQHVRFGLNGMTIAFSELYNKYNTHIFLEASGSSAQLLQLLKLDKKMEDHASVSLQICRRKGYSDKKPRQAFEFLKDGILKAWEMREIALSESMLKANQLTYDNLLLILGIK